MEHLKSQFFDHLDIRSVSVGGTPLDDVVDDDAIVAAVVKKFGVSLCDFQVFIKSEIGPFSGAAKDRKSQARVSTALLERGVCDEIVNLTTVTSGNEVTSLRGTVEAMGLDATITAFVNEPPYTHPLMLEHIRSQADSVVVMKPDADYDMGVSVDFAAEAYRGIVWEILEAGVIPNHFYLPVGSGELAAQMLIASRWFASYGFLISVANQLDEDPLSAMQSIYEQRGRVGFGNNDRIVESKDFNGLLRYLLQQHISVDVKDICSYLPQIVLASEEGQFLSRFSYDKDMGFGVNTTYYPARDGITHVTREPGVARKLSLPCIADIELKAESSLPRVLGVYPNELVRIVLCSGEEITSGWQFLRDCTFVQAEPSGAVPFAACLKELQEKNSPVLKSETVVILNSGCGTYVTPDGSELVLFERKV